MRAYELKKGHFKNIEGQKLFNLVKESFGNANEEGPKISTSSGALAKMVVWTDGKFLFVETNMNKHVSDYVARQTISSYNRFLEKATGFTAKERAQGIKKWTEG